MTSNEFLVKMSALTEEFERATDQIISVEVTFEIPDRKFEWNGQEFVQAEESA